MQVAKIWWFVWRWLPCFILEAEVFWSWLMMSNCIKQRFDHPGYRIFSQWSHYSSKPVCKMILNLSSKMCTKLTKMTWIKTSYSPNLWHLEWGSSNRQNLARASQYLMSENTLKTSLLLNCHFFSSYTSNAAIIGYASYTNASPERSFSALRVKTYLCATMSQEHLNYLMLLHIHTERTVLLDLKTVNELIAQNTIVKFLQNLDCYMFVLHNDNHNS